MISFRIQAPSTVHFEIKGRQSGGEHPPYTGDYEVTPKVHSATVLETVNKYMTDDVTVKKIPQYEVSNPSGGVTLTIGDDIL